MFKLLVLPLLQSFARDAVGAAEENFGAGKGLQKKKFAVNYVLARINFPVSLRAIFEGFLVSLIGEAIELAHSRLFACKTS